MENPTPPGEMPLYRVPGGVCREDLDGGRLEFEVGQSTFGVGILAGTRAVEQASDAAAQREGATFWDCLDAVRVALVRLGVPEAVCDPDFADAAKHRLQVAFSKKKAAQRNDFAALSNSAPSTATGSED